MQLKKNIGKNYVMKQLMLIGLTIIMFVAITGCVGLARNYKPAGFDSSEEVKQYLPYNFYFAKKLSSDEWDIFYKRFPEYWNDLQAAHHLGGTMEYHPWYTAYAFRWTTLNEKLPNWDQSTRERLSDKKVLTGDDIFKIMYALTPPDRLIWDNDFEILIYRYNSTAIIMNEGLLKEIKKCEDCWQQQETPDQSESYVKIGFTDNDVVAKLGLARPSY